MQNRLERAAAAARRDHQIPRQPIPTPPVELVERHHRRQHSVHRRRRPLRRVVQEHQQFSAGRRAHAANSPSTTTETRPDISPRSSRNDQNNPRSRAYASTVFGERSIRSANQGTRR